MGYTLKIGELEVDFNTSDGLESSIRLTARMETLNNAPAYGEPTDHTNQRWPSYTSWHDSMRFIGLYDFMFDEHEGVLRDHPGCTPLIPEHKEIVDAAYKRFYEKYPNCKPGYSPKATDFQEDPDWPVENGYAVRLEWLKFWIDWALENCERPVFYNS